MQESYEYRKVAGPIIESPLDTDSYIDTMGQMILHRHPDVPVTFSFMNRTKDVRLADMIDMGELREQLDHVRQSVRYGEADLEFMAGVRMHGQAIYRQDYIDFLRGFRFPEYELGAKDGQLILNFHGKWPEVMRWEIPGMSIINELYVESMLKRYTDTERKAVWKEAERRLGAKIDALSGRKDITFCDFGTRRRASRAWQDYLIGTLADSFSSSQFTGTSNVFLSKKYCIEQKGTNAHQLGMVYSGIYYDEDESDTLASQRRVLEDWESEYGLALSIFLPDTYGSDYFFEHTATPGQIQAWKGSRHDSGYAKYYIDKRVQMYSRLGVDPMSKLVICADGLQVPESLFEYADHAKGRIPVTFGPGTNLTNDIGLCSEHRIRPVSIIIKPTMAAGHQVAKLSDNTEKATGSKEAVERMKRLTGYDVKYSEACEV